jgi:hypothetical protein
MTSTTTISALIVDALRRGDMDQLAALYTPDALIDLNVPQWRWQVGGTPARRALAEDFHAADRSATVHRVTPTTDGLLLEEDVSFTEHGETRRFRQMHAFRLDGEQIIEHVIYCTGVWDAATIARQAVEAPMIRS